METAIRVREVMTRHVVTCGADVDVLKAANKMISENVGCIVVVSEGEPAGIVTERDLVKKIITTAADPTIVTLGEIMTAPLITISPDASLRDAAVQMIKSNVKKLPVISKHGMLVGIITDTDLVSGASVEMSDILSDLIEMHRESATFEEPKEMIGGICEHCGQFSDSLRSVGGELLCWSCRDSSV